MENEALDLVIEYLKKNNLRVVTAESCTAGLIASTLAEPPGCGQWLESAFVTYSVDSKIKCLNVDADLIHQYGLTSEEVARAMSEGALAISDATVAIATTGLAGPSGGDEGPPVGTVCIAWTFQTSDGPKTMTETTHFDGERNNVREAATHYALMHISKHHKRLASHNRQ